MLPMNEQIAAYVLCLENCAAATHRTEDRPIYEKYLCNAAGLLAASIAGNSKKEIQRRLDQHERLWGQTWLQDEVYKPAAEAWTLIKHEWKRVK